MKIKFVKNPTGSHNLAYNVGEEVEFADAVAATLINDGVAVPVTPAVEKATGKEKEEPAAETATTSKPKAETASAGPKKKK